MRLNYLANAIGLTMIYIGLVILTPVLVALIYQDYSSIIPFITASVISVGLGYIFRKSVPDSMALENLNDIKKAEALFIVAFSWIIFGFISAIPYLFYNISPINSLFEAVSGITTTGATIFTHYNYPNALFFWRSFTQWLGGLGIIVLFIAILPQFAVAGRQMFFAEAPGPTEEKFTPRIKNTASALWKIYAGLTVLETVLLMWAGMNGFDALCNSLSTISAGGFSPNPDSICGYHSNCITRIIIFFMFFAGTSFNLQYKVIMRKNPILLFKNEEFRAYLFTIILMTSLIAFTFVLNTNNNICQNITDALFQVISITTSTGFASLDFSKLNYTPELLLFITMFIGSCSGSAGGGIKMARWLVVIKSMKSEISKILHPNAVINLKLDNKTIPTEVTRQIIVFVFFYFLIFGITAILMSIFEHNSATGLTAAITSLGNIGPTMTSATGPMTNFDNIHICTKIIFIINMFVGRLELIPFMVMLQPSFWTLKEN